MWLSKHASELIQRATCHFKPNTYFLHTTAPLPSILVVLPNRMQRIAPLLNRLVNQEQFLLSQQLSTVKGDPPGQSQQKRNQQAESSFNSIYGIPFNSSTSFICSNLEGKLQLTKSPTRKDAIIAVILFSNVQDKKIASLSSRNYENLTITLKAAALVSLFCVFNELKYSTRPENQSKRT